MTMSKKTMQRAFLVELVSKLELLSWSSVQPRDSGRHVKENKRSILDGPFVEGLARGFYVHTEREGGREGKDEPTETREILASSVNWGCSIAKSRIRRLIRAKIVPFQTVSNEETWDWTANCCCCCCYCSCCCCLR